MGYCYEKLWNRAYNYHLNKTSLRDKAGLSNSTLARLSKNKTVSMEVLARLCECLECDIGDIVEYKKDGEKNELC